MTNFRKHLPCLTRFQVASGATNSNTGQIRNNLISGNVVTFSKNYLGNYTLTTSVDIIINDDQLDATIFD